MMMARVSRRVRGSAGFLQVRGLGGHLREILAYTGWQAIDVPGWKKLDEFLFARAMEHNSPKLLFRLACEYLAAEHDMRGQYGIDLEDLSPGHRMP